MTEIPVTAPSDQAVQAASAPPNPTKPLDLQPLINASPDLIHKFLRVTSTGELVGTISAYVLGATIIGCATILALRGVIEGQAIAGFLGAAIGYIFAKTSA